MFGTSLKVKGNEVILKRGSKKLRVPVSAIEGAYVSKRKLGNPHVVVVVAGQQTKFKCLSMGSAQSLANRLNQLSKTA